MDSFVPLLRKCWVDKVGWLAEMFIGEAQLQCGLKRLHPASASAETGTSQGADLPGFRTVVAMNCGQGSPQGYVNMVDSLNVHRHSHSGSVGYKWVGRMPGGDDYACANGLLAKVILQNALLNQLHYMPAKISNHSQVHAGVH